MSDFPLFSSEQLKLLTITDKEAARFRAEGRRCVFEEPLLGSITVYVLPDGKMMFDDLEIYNLD